MFIDLTPPDNPEKGDVWIRLGEIRTWSGGWDPVWDPPADPAIPRKRRKRDG